MRHARMAVQPGSHASRQAHQQHCWVATQPLPSSRTGQGQGLATRRKSRLLSSSIWQSTAAAATTPTCSPPQATFCRQSPPQPVCAQAELYSLTTRGGPRYAPRSVNQAAFEVLDALFPLGQRSRRLVSLTFRLALHPGEWPRSLLLTLQSLLYAVVWPGVATWRALSRLPA